jgi:SM-20-related protein
MHATTMPGRPVSDDAENRLELRRQSSGFAESESVRRRNAQPAIALQTRFDAGDLAALNADFALDQRIRLTGFLMPGSAQLLARNLYALPDFHQACFVNNDNRLISARELACLAQADRERLLGTVNQQAANGIGYWYGRYKPPEQGCLIRDSLFSWLNGGHVLSRIRAISGMPDIARASLQITRFTPGDFLTRHRDTVVGENRRLAYVINLAGRWHPDWGGLLQFYRDNGAPRDAWSPEFNSFGLFDVRHVHAVTMVTPFAMTPRLTISGWFHA